MGDDCNELVADWLNSVHISSTEFDNMHVQEMPDCVTWLQSANWYHSTSECRIRVSNFLKITGKQSSNQQ